MKEKGDNLTSDRLAQLTVGQMIAVIIAKAGVVSFTRVMRVVQDALVVQGSSPNIEKETILGYMFDNTALVLLDEQSIVGNSSLVFPDSKRNAAIRDLAML